MSTFEPRLKAMPVCCQYTVHLKHQYNGLFEIFTLKYKFQREIIIDNFSHSGARKLEECKLEEDPKSFASVVF